MADKNATKSYAEELGVEPISLSVAALVTQLCWVDKHVPLLIGESGIGKTAIIKQLGRFNRMRVELYALAHMESTDMTGPMYASRTRPDTYTFLRDGRIPFKGFDDENEPAVVFTDEANRAEMTTLNAAFPLWTERRIGPHGLGPNVVVAAAMNPPEGDYAVTSQFSHDPAMRRRVCQIYVAFNMTSFLEHASNPQRQGRLHELFQPLQFPDDFEEERRNRPYHDAVLEFLRAKPDMGLDRASRDAGKVYACPATWEAVSDTLYTVDNLQLDLNEAIVELVVRTKLSGNVGSDAARQVLDFFKKVTDAIIPREVLFDYRAGTPVYKKVQRAINRGDNAQLANLIEGLAIELHGSDELSFELDEVIEQLALLYHDLPTQQGKALDAARTAKEKENTGRLNRRLVKIQKMLNLQPKYQEARNRLVDTYVQGRDEMQAAEEELKARMNQDK